MVGINTQSNNQLHENGQPDDGLSRNLARRPLAAHIWAKEGLI
jgi:hypothetical protein